MNHEQFDESDKFEMVRVLSDAHELIDHLTQLYQVVHHPRKEHVKAGIVDASVLVVIDSSGD